MALPDSSSVRSEPRISPANIQTYKHVRLFEVLSKEFEGAAPCAPKSCMPRESIWRRMHHFYRTGVVCANEGTRVVEVEIALAFGERHAALWKKAVALIALCRIVVETRPALSARRAVNFIAPDIAWCGHHPGLGRCGHSIEHIGGRVDNCWFYRRIEGEVCSGSYAEGDRSADHEYGHYSLANNLVAHLRAPLIKLQDIAANSERTQS